MGDENLAEFAAARAGKDALRAYLEKEAEALGVVTADDVLVAFGDLVSGADRPALTGEFAKYVAAATEAV